MSKAVKFSPKELLDAFNKAKGDNKIIIDEYVRGYNELTRFFEILGSVFGYINSDILEKVTILKFYREGDLREHYHTVESMMAYEISVKS